MEFEKQEMLDIEIHIQISRFKDRKKIGKNKHLINDKSAPEHVVVSAACFATDITEANFYSGVRRRPFVLARKLFAVYVLSNKSHSLSHVARLIGVKSHCTVLNYEVKYRNFKDTKDKEQQKAEDFFLDYLRQKNAGYSLIMDSLKRFQFSKIDKP